MEDHHFRSAVVHVLHHDAVLLMLLGAFDQLPAAVERIGRGHLRGRVFPILHRCEADRDVPLPGCRVVHEVEVFFRAHAFEIGFTVGVQRRWTLPRLHCPLAGALRMPRAGYRTPPSARPRRCRSGSVHGRNPSRDTDKADPHGFQRGVPRMAVRAPTRRSGRPPWCSPLPGPRNPGKNAALAPAAPSLRRVRRSMPGDWSPSRRSAMKHALFCGVIFPILGKHLATANPAGERSGQTVSKCWRRRGPSCMSNLDRIARAGGCDRPDPTERSLRESSAATLAVKTGSYQYEYQGSGSLAGSYSGTVSFQMPRAAPSTFAPNCRRPPPHR